MYDHGDQQYDEDDYDEGYGNEYRSRTQAKQSGPLPGWIYCLRNPSIPNQLKIGLTTQAVENRMRQLDTTGVATPFEVVQKWLTGDVRRDEAAIHKMLEKYRTRSNREWFSIPDARTDQLLVHINRYIRRANHPLYDLPTEMPEINESRWEKARGSKRLSIKLPKSVKEAVVKERKKAQRNAPRGVAGFATGVGYVVLGTIGIAVLIGVFGGSGVS